MNALLLTHIPIILALAWCIYRTNNRGGRQDAAIIAACGSIILVNAIIRHFVFEGYEPQSCVIITQQLLASLIIPLAYLFFAMQANTNLINSCSITLFSLIALLLFPNINIVTATDPTTLPLDAILPDPSQSASVGLPDGPASEVSSGFPAGISWQGSASLLREMTTCKTLNIIADTTIYQYTIADLIISLQAIVTMARVAPLLRRLRNNGMQISHDVKVFTAWWGAAAAFVVFASIFSDTNHTNDAINTICNIVFTIIMAGIFYLLGRGINFQPEVIEKETTVPEASASLFTAKSKEMAQQLVALINDKRIHIKQNYTVDNAIDELRTNRTYFYRMLKEEFGCTFSELMNRERVKEIQHLLTTTDESISSISSRCGFKNTSYMIKIFKQLEGVTPSEWKKNQQ